MTRIIQVVLLLGLIAFASASQDIPYPPTTLTQTLTTFHEIKFGEIVMGGASFTNFDSEQTSGDVSGFLNNQCQWDYWRLDAAAAWGSSLGKGDYLNVNVSIVNFVPYGPPADFYVAYSLDGNRLPTREDFDWVITVTANATNDLNSAFLELMPCELYAEGYYWFGLTPNSNYVNGFDNEIDYVFEVRRRRVLGASSSGVFDFSGDSITPLTLGQTYTAFEDSRPYNGITVFGDQANTIDQDRVRDWHYFSLDVSGVTYVEGSYLVVNVSRIVSNNTVDNLEVAINFGEVPYWANGHLDGQTDPEGNSPSGCYNDICFDSGDSYSSCLVGPEAYPCEVFPGNWSTALLVVGPCTFTYDLSQLDGSSGNLFYIGIRLPFSFYDFVNDQDVLEFTSYSILANVVSPTVETLSFNTPARGLANLPNQDLIVYDNAVHYRFTIDANEIGPNTNLVVQTSNIYGGTVLTSLRLFDGTPGQTFPDYTLAYDDADLSPYSGCNCYPTLDFSCKSCSECQITVHKCQLSAGDWYVSVRALTVDDSAPVDFTIEVSLYDDPLPAVLLAGVPAYGNLDTGLYDFYVLDVPATTTTWLYVELFVRSTSSNAAGSVQMLANELPGETCFPEGDFLCQTDNDLGSCTFVVDTCHLQEGPIYLSVYSLPTDDPEDGTYQTSPLVYTLWAEFESPWQVLNGVTYSDVVVVGEYNHYYFLAENIVPGSDLTVEIDNVQSSQSTSAWVNSYLNYGSLAGECPCYESQYNCTGTPAPGDCEPDAPFCELNYGINYGLELQTYSNPSDTVLDRGCCKLEVDGCSFTDGIYYISVAGHTTDGSIGNVQLGYTLTVNVHPAPEVNRLPMNVPWVDRVAPYTYNHYLLAGAMATPMTNLLIDLTWMQDECGRYDGILETNDYPVDQLTSNGQLQLRLQPGALAFLECYDYPFSCYADRDSYSSCTVLVPYCQWSKITDDIYLSVYYVESTGGDPGPNLVRKFSDLNGVTIPADSPYPAQYTIRAYVEKEVRIDVTPGESYAVAIAENRYLHFTLPVDPAIHMDSKLIVDLYHNIDRTNDDNGSPTFLLNFNDYAGGYSREDDFDVSCVECHTHEYYCNNADVCHWEFDPCTLSSIGDTVYYFALYSPYQDFFGLSSEATFTAYFENAVTDLAVGEVLTSTVQSSQNHYRLVVLNEPDETTYLTINFRGLNLNSGTIYFNREAQAGECPCYSSSQLRSWDSTDFCGTGTIVQFLFPPCEYTAGSYYWNIIPDTDGELQTFQIDIFETTSPVNDFGTLTNLLSASSTTEDHLGVDLSTLYFDDEIETWWLPSLWNSDVALYGIELTQDAPLVHYTFTADPTSIVYYVFTNVVQPACSTQLDEVTAWFNSDQGPYTPLSSNDNCEPSCPDAIEELCSFRMTGDPGIGCSGQLPRCLVSSSTNYLSIQAYFNPEKQGSNPNPTLEYSAGVSSITFNMKLFTQDPYPLQANDERNVTHYFNGPQEFVLNGVAFAGVAPITQIVFRQIAFPITVWARPAPVPGEPSFCADGACYDNNCVEIHGGHFVSTTEVQNGFSIPSGLLDFQPASCGEYSTCTVSLMPCALKQASSTTWYIHVEVDTSYGTASSSAGNFDEPLYSIEWDNLGDVAASAITVFPQNFIDSRARYPGPEPPAAGPETFDFTVDMDTYLFYRVDITGITNSISTGNTSVDNSDYTRLEIQITEVDDNTIFPGVTAVFIAKGVPDATSDNTIIQTYGMPPVFPLGNADLNSTVTESECDVEACGDSPIYVCYNRNCDSRGGSFVVPSCCLSDGTYWIVMRQLTPGAVGYGIRVRLVEEKQGTNLVTFVDSSQFGNDITSPPEGTAEFTLIGLTNSASGIEPENYIHYYTAISESQFFIGTTTPPTRWSLIFNLTIDDDLVTTDRQSGDVWLFVRRGSRAGNSAEFASGISFEDDNCLTTTYLCTVEAQDDRCVIEIPSNQLAADNWYFSLYNDAWYPSYAGGLKDPLDTSSGSDNGDYNNLGYELEIYFRPEALNDFGDRVSIIDGDERVGGFCLNQTENGPSPYLSGTSSQGTFIHYSFQLTQTALDECNSGSATVDCRFEKTLIIEIENFDEGTNYPLPTTMDVFLSFPMGQTVSGVAYEMAAQPGGANIATYAIPLNQEDAFGWFNYPGFLDTLSLDESETYTSTVCDTTHPVRAGIYYVSIRSYQERQINVCAYLSHPVYEVLNAFTGIVPSETNDETGSVLVGSFSFSNDGVFDNTDPSDWYFVFTISDAQASNQLNYLDINITNIINCDTVTCAALPNFNQFNVEVWRSDCAAWSCPGPSCTGPYPFAIDTTGGSFDQDGEYRRAIIHDMGMTPCTLEAGQYYIHITNPLGFYDFDLEVRLREALLLPVSFDTPVVSQIWAFQYHMYELAYTGAPGRSILATLSDVSCGSLWMTAKFGTPAGPFPYEFISDLTDTDVTETCESCATAYCNTDDNQNWCDIFLDTCETRTLDSTWYFTVYGVEQTLDLINLLDSPITYTVSFSTELFEFVDTVTGCPNTLQYDNSVPACSEPVSDANLPPQQFVFNFEYAPLFSQVRFTLDAQTPSFMLISQNTPVNYLRSDPGQQYYCADALTLTDGDQTFDVSQCGDSTSSSSIDGTTQFFVWVQGESETTSVTMERWIPYVPLVYPNIEYYGAINTPDSGFLRPPVQYYRIMAPEVTLSQAVLVVDSVYYGSVRVDLITLASLSCVSSATVGTVSNLNVPYPILLSDEAFVSFTGVTQECDSPCEAVQYSFHIEIPSPAEPLECNSFSCYSVDLATDRVVAAYELDPPVFEIDYAQDTDFEGRLVTFEWTYIDGGSMTCNIAGPEIDCGDQTTYTEAHICPKIDVVISGDGANTFSLGATCTPIPISDKTTEVLSATGFQSPVHNEALFVYSFDLGAATTLEFTELVVSVDSLCGVATLTLSHEGPSDGACDISGGCDLVPDVYYYTIHCDSDECAWVFNAQLVTVENNALTLNAKSNLFVLNPGSHAIYYFDVPASSIQPDSFVQVEILAVQSNSDTPLQALLTSYGSNYEIDCCGFATLTGPTLEVGYTADSSYGTTSPLVIRHCDLEATRYYLWVWELDASCTAHPTQFSVRPLLLSSGIAVLALSNNAVSDSVYGTPNVWESNFYSVAAPADDTFAQFSLANVVGGDLRLYIQANALPLGPTEGFVSFTEPSPYQGHYSVADIFVPNVCDFNPGSCGYLALCDTSDYKYDSNFPENLGCGSCSIYVSPCEYSGVETFYMLVSNQIENHDGAYQTDYSTPITYDLIFQSYAEYEAVAPGDTSTPVTFSSNSVTSPRSTFAYGNYEYFFYSVSTDQSPRSVRVEFAYATVDVDSPPVAVIDIWISDNDCDVLDSDYHHTCNAEANGYVCDFAVPTRAEFFSDNYYIVIGGEYGSFSVSFTAGSDNCEVPTESLTFCSGYVNYPVWSVANFAQLDSEASCVYEELKWRFERERSDETDCPLIPCWTGISSACDDELRRFACYESFPPCDHSGFVTGSCRETCNTVESVCQIAFASVDLEHYDCNSSRYLNGQSEVCAGKALLPAPVFDF